MGEMGFWDNQEAAKLIVTENKTPQDGHRTRFKRCCTTSKMCVPCMNWGLKKRRTGTRWKRPMRR